MNILPVRVPVSLLNEFTEAETVLLPLAIPDMLEVRLLAEELHAAGVAYHGTRWGWPVQYEPELVEPAAEYQMPDGQGGWRTEIRPFWSPASFTMGQNGFWFYSLLWDHGRDQPPTPYLEPQDSLLEQP
jgi:hypothetical protein